MTIKRRAFKTSTMSCMYISSPFSLLNLRALPTKLVNTTAPSPVAS